MALGLSFTASESKDAKTITLTDTTDWAGDGYLTADVTSSIIYVILPGETSADEITVTATTLPGSTLDITPYDLGLTTDPTDTETQFTEGNYTIRWELTTNPGAGAENYEVSGVLLAYKITLGKVMELVADMASETNDTQRAILLEGTTECWMLLQAALDANERGMYTQSEYFRSLCYDTATIDPIP